MRGLFDHPFPSTGTICTARAGSMGLVHCAVLSGTPRLESAALLRPFGEGPAIEPKLRVGIHFDLDRRTARLEVRGMVTDQNCRVLYVLARRANTALPGLTVLLDLRRARVTEDAMAGLVRSSETGLLPVPVVHVKGEALAPRQLSILAPA